MCNYVQAREKNANRVHAFVKDIKRKGPVLCKGDADWWDEG